MDKKIEYYESWCKGCGICAAFCPKDAIKMDKMAGKPVFDEEKCISCGLCELRCPDYAIIINKKKKGKE